MLFVRMSGNRVGFGAVIRGVYRENRVVCASFFEVVVNKIGFYHLIYNNLQKFSSFFQNYLVFLLTVMKIVVLLQCSI